MSTRRKSDKDRIKGASGEHEATLEMLLDAIPLPVFYKDRVGCYLSVNKSFESLFGAPRKQLIGKNVFDLNPKEYTEVWHARDNELLKTGITQQHEAQIKNADGEIRNFIVNKAAVKDQHGKITGLIGTLQDITERDQANEAQQRLNRELQAISSCRQAMIRATDERALINDICRIVCDEAGYRMAWVGYIEHDEAKTIHPIAWYGENAGYMEQARLSWSEETERGRGPAGEATRSGRSFYVEDIATDPRMTPWRDAALQRGYRASIGAPIKDENGEVIALLSVYSDRIGAFTQEALRLIEGLASDMSFGITMLRTRAERIRTETALRESEEKYRAIFHNSPLGVFRSSIDGRFVEVNPALARMLGFDSPEALIREIDDIGEQLYVHPENRQRIVSRQLSAPGDSMQHFNHYRRKDGSECIAHLYLKTVRDEEGRPLYFDGIIEDITEQSRKEEERKKLQDQLAQAQKMESIGRLAGGIAHDFNNMLGVIIGYTELALRRSLPDQKLHHQLQEISKAARSSSSLTRQLLAFARKQTITPVALNLNETVDGMFKMLGRLIGEDVHLIWLPGQETWQVKVDPSQIDQILANLCINASDAMEKGGELAIETRDVTIDQAFCAQHTGAVPGDYVLLTVRDTGSGMDSETLARAFDPFFTTKAMGKGTGLGLATVYGIVKQNSGFIDIKSTLGQGTSVEIYLPRHTESGQSGTHMTLQERIKDGSETILLVEDEPAILDITRLMLEECGYRVLTASTPATGIHMAREYGSDIHLLITDVIMPGMNGRELANEIIALFPDTKQLFMSGYPNDAIAHQGILDGGVHFIQKPFSMQLLATKVREILDSI